MHLFTIKSALRQLIRRRRRLRCYILELPPELRLLIYEQLWDGLRPVGVFMKPGIDDYCHVARDANMLSPSRWPDYLCIIDRRTFALLGTCRLIRQEARPIMHKKVHLDISVPRHAYQTPSNARWRPWYLLRHARSASIRATPFFNRDTSSAHAQLFAHLANLEELLPGGCANHTLCVVIGEHNALASHSCRAFKHMSWSGKIFINIHRDAYARIMILRRRRCCFCLY